MSRLAVAAKFERRSQQVARRRRYDPRLCKRKWFVVVFFQLRFVVERVDLGRPAVHEQENDPLGFGSEMRRADLQITFHFAVRLFRQQPGQRKRAEPDARLAEQVATRKGCS